MATEVVKEVIVFSFDRLGLSRVVAETQTANIASCKLLEKIGMQVEATYERFGAEQAFYVKENMLYSGK